MPEKEPIWKVRSHIKQFFIDAIKGRLEGVSELFGKIHLPSAIKSATKNVSGSGVEIPKQAESFTTQSIEETLEEFIKADVPGWISVPSIFVVSILVMVKSLLDTAAVTGERVTMQKLRASIRPLLLDPQSVIDGSRRKILDKDYAKETLERLGFKDQDIDSLFLLAEYVPGAQDIVSFAVRESYDDGVAGRFGNDDNLSAVLDATKEDREAAGLSDDQFKKFWRAHWALPGIGQFFEAFQRGFLSSGDLDLALRIKDISPFFRDMLTKIAYSPITRVDVRRMHKIGILSDSEIVKRYQDVGYNPEDAQSMADFTIQYNRDPETAEQTETDKTIAKERDLTKADILNAYKNGTVDRKLALQIFKDGGYDENEAELLIGRIDLQKTQKITDRLIDGYKDVYVKGLINTDEVTNYLQAIPITAEEIAQLLTLWNIDIFSRLDMPSKTDILKWFKKKYIKEEKAKELLLSIGTQEQFINYYLWENR